MRILISILLLLLSGFTFATEVLINTYDKTGYVFDEDNQLIASFKAECDAVRISSVVSNVYRPLHLTVDYFPLPVSTLLILEEGQTLGANEGDICVGEKAFELLYQKYCSEKKSITVNVDFYPIEIYSDRIVIKEEITREKFQHFVQHFLPDLAVWYPITPGVYPLKSSRLKPEFALYTFPGIGGGVIPIFHNEPCSLKWNIDGIETTRSAVFFGPGEHQIDAVYDLSFNSQWQQGFRVFVPYQRVLFSSTEVSLGGVSSGNYEDYFFLDGIEPHRIFSIPCKTTLITVDPPEVSVVKITVQDDMQPIINIQCPQKTSGLLPISIKVEDASAAEVQVYVDGEKIELTQGILDLEEGYHVVTVFAVDAFGNSSFNARKVLRIPRLPTGKAEVVFHTSEELCDIGGFKFISPYVLSWSLSGSISTFHMGVMEYEISGN